MTMTDPSGVNRSPNSAEMSRSVSMERSRELWSLDNSNNQAGFIVRSLAILAACSIARVSSVHAWATPVLEATRRFCWSLFEMRNQSTKMIQASFCSADPHKYYLYGRS